MTYIERIHNVETGEIIDQEYTKDQIKDAELEFKKTLQIQKELNAKEAERKAIAEKLDLTTDELQVLLG